MGKPVSAYDKPITEERITARRKQLQTMMASWPESRAKAKAQRKAALIILDELLQEIGVLEQHKYDNLMSSHTRQSIVHKIETRLKLE